MFIRGSLGFLDSEQTWHRPLEAISAMSNSLLTSLCMISKQFVQFLLLGKLETELEGVVYDDRFLCKRGCENHIWLSAMTASNYHSMIAVIMVWQQIQSEFGGEDIK